MNEGLNPIYDEYPRAVANSILNFAATQPSEDFENLLTLSFKKRTGNNWKRTVGKRQPQRHKQVFIHQCL